MEREKNVEKMYRMKYYVINAKFYGEMLRMLRNRLYDFVKDICKYNNFTHEKTEEIQYIMRVLMYEIL